MSVIVRSDLPIRSIEDMEHQMIVKAMRQYGGSLTKVAAMLGLTRQALYRRLEKYNLDN